MCVVDTLDICVLPLFRFEKIVNLKNRAQISDKNPFQHSSATSVSRMKEKYNSFLHISLSHIFQTNTGQCLDWHIMPTAAVYIDEAGCMRRSKMVPFGFYSNFKIDLFLLIFDQLLYRRMANDQMVIRDWIWC